MDEEDFKDDIYLRSRWCGLLHPNTGISQVATATITTTTDAPTQPTQPAAAVTARFVFVSRQVYDFIQTAFLLYILATVPV